MRNRIRAVAAVATCALLPATLAACGSSSSSSSSGGGGSSTTQSSSGPSLPLKPGEDPAGQQLTGKKRGGALTVYSSEDFEHLDPGESYFSLDYAVDVPTQRTLFQYRPNNAEAVSPDLATAIPTVSNGGITDGGRVLTVHIHKGVKFSPPVNREVTSADIAYAIERGANPNVGNPYYPSYFGAASPTPLVGADKSSYKGGPIPGIKTPDKYTLVFTMTKPGAGFLIQALSLPLSAPVPQEFAGPLDKKSPTTYGTQYLVATGPYMIKSDKTGKFQGIGYQTGKSLTLVRNPNWDASTDFRPAYLDTININIGGAAAVIGEQTLKGTHTIQLDTPSQPTVKTAYLSYPSQITFTTGSGDHYIGVDTQAGVFKNVNIRRAVWAALNRAAIVKTRGGKLTSEPMTHFIYPGVDGFDEAGGYAGPPVDYNKNVNGDPAVAAKYMKLAGYPSGKYTGTDVPQIVTANNGDDPAIAQIIVQAMNTVGLHPKVNLVDQSVMYAKYCGVPKQHIDACPAVGWIRDFADPLTVLYPTFYGPSIVPENNSNWSQFNDPQVNAAMQQAAQVVDLKARAAAWANIDKLLVNDAAAIPEEFDNQPNIESKNVAGVNQVWNEGTWDFDFTSLK